jgi:hypothetical protein
MCQHSTCKRLREKREKARADGAPLKTPHYGVANFFMTKMYGISAMLFVQEQDGTWNPSKGQVDAKHDGCYLYAAWCEAREEMKISEDFTTYLANINNYIQLGGTICFITNVGHSKLDAWRERVIASRSDTSLPDCEREILDIGWVRQDGLSLDGCELPLNQFGKRVLSEVNYTTYTG